MATHSSVLAWRIPGTGKPGGLPSMGSHRVRHDWSDSAVAVCHKSSRGGITSRDELRYERGWAYVTCKHQAVLYTRDLSICGFWYPQGGGAARAGTTPCGFQEMTTHGFFPTSYEGTGPMSTSRSQKESHWKTTIRKVLIGIPFPEMLLYLN